MPGDSFHAVWYGNLKRSGKNDIYSRSEFDHAEAVAGNDLLSGFEVADDPSCYESRYLAEPDSTCGGIESYFHSFVIRHAAMVKCHQKLAWLVAYVHYPAIKGNPVDVNVERGHENADKGGILTGDRVIDMLFEQDSSIGRCNEQALSVRNFTIGIAIEKKCEEEEKKSDRTKDSTAWLWQQ
jgi:hypothetical protein